MSMRLLFEIHGLSSSVLWTVPHGVMALSDRAWESCHDLSFFRSCFQAGAVGTPKAFAANGASTSSAGEGCIPAFVLFSLESAHRTALPDAYSPLVQFMLLFVHCCFLS
jgi:hypothetical protein